MIEMLDDFTVEVQSWVSINQQGPEFRGPEKGKEESDQWSGIDWKLLPWRARSAPIA
jgi:hypothetical protein